MLSTGFNDTMIGTNGDLYKLSNDLSYKIQYLSAMFVFGLIVHAIYMDIRQGMLSKEPTLIYYYEDRDVLLGYVGRIIASFF
tara:strand:+ start:888 stop:1133 length:246 start_codon:yes stop_codon:yes gene_type:complete